MNRIKLTKLDNIQLNIGCGNQREAGFIGLDKGDYGQEIVWDIRKGIPLPDNSCFCLMADSVLEHIQLNEDFVLVMNECLRVLKPQGKFEIIVPFWKSEIAIKDPTHCRFFHEMTFTYLQKENPWEYGFDKRWKILECKQLPGNNNLHVILIADK